MKKCLASIFLIIFGLMVLLVWEAGSHGSHLRFRPWMVEDWLLSLLIIGSFGTSIYFLISWVKDRHKRRK